MQPLYEAAATVPLGHITEVDNVTLRLEQGAGLGAVCGDG